VRYVFLLCIALVPTTACLSFGFARWMRRRSLGQRIREYGPDTHKAKAGTPTMGGLAVLVIWIAAASSLWIAIPPTAHMGFPLAAGVLFGAIGAADDVVALRYRRSLGLSPLAKIALITLVTVILFFSFKGTLSVRMLVPFSGLTVAVPPVTLFFFAWLAFLATSNGMNLTDGLDGLAAGVSILALAGILMLAPSHENLAALLPLIAVLVGFLWMNTFPAALFLGDVGSFALGGVVAAAALVNGLAFLLPLLAGVIVLEVGSVIFQLGCLKWTGRRLFKMSPLHHHFEATEPLKGGHFLPAARWAEPKITVRFWILEALFVGLAVFAGRLAA
jgi:phospho-N-acetylmuramoyl-pentapeptide-transferase